MNTSAALDALAVVAGIALVAFIAADVFQSVVVPRPARSLRPSAVLVRRTWPLVGRIGMHFRDVEHREDFYGTFAPAALTVLLAIWLTGLVLAFGLAFWGLRHALHPEAHSYAETLYYAGTSLLTLGYGDITGTSPAVRLLSLCAAALGLGTFAIVTAFLFALFAAFQRREAFIVTLRERTGAPPSGVEYLLRIAQLDMLDDLPETFRAAEAWLADMMETHLAYPILSYFRSTHDGQSWVATTGALLDAATLVITTVDVDHHGRAKMLSRLGRHLVVDFAHYYHFDAAADVGIERHEFDTVYAMLRDAGLPMRPQAEAWPAFAALRATYAGALNAMAHYWRIPPAQWVGDRSQLPLSRHGATPAIPQPAVPSSN